jgi:taurine dioxygenase
MAITLQNLAPFGVEITGVDVSEAEEDVIFNLKYLLAHHGVVILRHQWIDDAEFFRFLKRLGPLMFTAGENPVPHQPWLNLVSNVGCDRTPRSVFHTDTSYVAQPPAYTALKAISLPKLGGETLFSNQYVAFETLSTQVKEKLSGATVLHVASGVQLDSEQESQSWHPLFSATSYFWKDCTVSINPGAMSGDPRIESGRESASHSFTLQAFNSPSSALST